MKSLKFMGVAGDRELEFDETMELGAIRAEAREQFDLALANGARAFTGKTAVVDKPVKSFDELQDYTIVATPLSAG